MRTALILFSLLQGVGFPFICTAREPSVAEVQAAMKRASQYFHSLAVHGGYVYHYSLDGTRRWGEGLATDTQIWVQPPGTPTVGEAYLIAYQATDDPFFKQAAVDAALALVAGQLESGGWTNLIDFNPRSEQAGRYRSLPSSGQNKDAKNHSSLDDDQTTAALRFLMRVDRLLQYQHRPIHDATIMGLQSLLNSQYACGAFPQVWMGPVTVNHPRQQATYPKLDWRTEGRVKNYWDMYTLNDNVTGNVCDTLLLAHRIYGDARYLEAVRRLGDWLLAAQMPEPQRGWAQQYDYDMHPIWARKFEPPAVASDETQEVIATLIKIAAATNDRRYLQPIESAIRWLKRSRLESGDGQLARYYELQTNRPLYMERQGDVYTLTHNDDRLPDHYGWKIDDRTAELEQMLASFEPRTAGDDIAASERKPIDSAQVTELLQSLDNEGRWVSVYQGERLVGQPKMAIEASYLSSQLFHDHLVDLAAWLSQHKRATANANAPNDD